MADTRVLSINLCTVIPDSPRRERVLKVRQFVEDNDVDVVLFQEGLTVCWPVYSSLRNLLPKGYDLVSRPYIGVNWFYEFQVGVMSKRPILDTRSAYLEVPQRERLDAIPLLGRRRAVAALIGGIWFVSVHLSSSPQTQELRQKQVNELMSFLHSLPAGPVILGGDLNMDESNPAFKTITAELTLVGGVSPDYIFTSKGQGSTQLVLTSGVTDHSGGILADL